MDEMFARAWEHLIGRVTGPMMFRFILQPATAAILAVRAGFADAKQGRPPYLWSVITNRTERRALLRHGWHDVGKVFVLACVLDAVYQLFVLRWFYPLQTFIVACALAVVPYVVVRGPLTRLLLFVRRHKVLSSGTAVPIPRDGPDARPIRSTRDPSRPE